MRLYHVVAVHEKTKRETYVTGQPLPRNEAAARMRSCTRYQNQHLKLKAVDV